MEPEKKDVWELFDVALQESFYYVNGELVSISKTHLKDFIKTHFIPRAEVVERIDKLEPKLWDAKGKEFVPKSDLLDLLTQEK